MSNINIFDDFQQRLPLNIYIARRSKKYGMSQDGTVVGGVELKKYYSSDSDVCPLDEAIYAIGPANIIDGHQNIVLKSPLVDGELYEVTIENIVYDRETGFPDDWDIVITQISVDDFRKLSDYKGADND